MPMIEYEPHAYLNALAKREALRGEKSRNSLAELELQNAPWKYELAKRLAESNVKIGEHDVGRLDTLATQADKKHELGVEEANESIAKLKQERDYIQKKMEYLPVQMRMEEEKHLSDINMNIARIEGINTQNKIGEREYEYMPREQRNRDELNLANINRLEAETGRSNAETARTNAEVAAFPGRENRLNNLADTQKNEAQSSYQFNQIKMANEILKGGAMIASTSTSPGDAIAKFQVLEKQTGANLSAYYPPKNATTEEFAAWRNNLAGLVAEEKQNLPRIVPPVEAMYNKHVASAPTESEIDKDYAERKENGTLPKNDLGDEMSREEYGDFIYNRWGDQAINLQKAIKDERSGGTQTGDPASEIPPPNNASAYPGHPKSAYAAINPRLAEFYDPATGYVIHPDGTVYTIEDGKMKKVD